MSPPLYTQDAPVAAPSITGPVPTGYARGRRLRRTAALREMVADVRLHPADFVSPYFVIPGSKQQQAIASMPDVFQWSVDQLLPRVEADLRLGIKAIMLFGVPDDTHKCDEGRHAASEKGLVQSATRALKTTFGDDLVVMTDTCLCEYTQHGHCGVIEGQSILNDESVAMLVQAALSQAEAGADIVCPSDMMDGRIGAIRDALDTQGFTDVAMMAYAIKHASRFYGPFRDAAGSTPQFGDRRSYQMDVRRDAREGLMEALQDETEGADILMVKPAMTNLDLLHQVRHQSQLPLAAYHVSGEYAMVKAAGLNGWLDEEAVLVESLSSMKRAGASLIVTYAAAQVAQQLTAH